MALRRMSSPRRLRPRGATLEMESVVEAGIALSIRHGERTRDRGAPAQVSGVGELEKELDGGRAVPLAGALGEEADGCGDGYVGGVVSRGLEG